MKKVMFFAIFSMIIGIHESKSQETGKDKLQYVKWTTVPKPESVEQVAGWLKQAMVHGTIAGADVRSTSESYVSVWGQALYDEILKTPVNSSDFSYTKSSGTEINHGVYEDGTPAAMQQPLASGMPVLAFKGVPIAKWGTNGCINALRPGSTVKKPKPISGKDVKTEVLNFTITTKEVNVEVPKFNIVEKQITIEVPKFVYVEKQIPVDNGGGCNHNKGCNHTNQNQEWVRTCSYSSNQGMQQKSGPQYVRNDVNYNYNEPGLGVKNWGMGIGSLLLGGAEMYRAINNDRQDINLNVRNISNGNGGGRGYSNTWNGNNGGSGGYNNTSGDFQGGPRRNYAGYNSNIRSNNGNNSGSGSSGGTRNSNSW